MTDAEVIERLAREKAEVEAVVALLDAECQQGAVPAGQPAQFRRRPVFPRLSAGDRVSGAVQIKPQGLMSADQACGLDRADLRATTEPWCPRHVPSVRGQRGRTEPKRSGSEAPAAERQLEVGGWSVPAGALHPCVGGNGRRVYPHLLIECERGEDTNALVVYNQNLVGMIRVRNNRKMVVLAWH